MKILFLVPYPSEGASNRYRVEQFLPYLRTRNIEYKLRPFIFSRYYEILYRKGRYFKKSIFFVFCSINRLIDVFFRIWFYNIVFIHIDVFPFGPAIFERFFSTINKKMVFDFEDAIYLKNGMARSWIGNRLRCPEKFFSTIKVCSSVIVCNNYLKEYLSAYNNNITVIPTSINTEIFIPLKHDNRIPEIGWIGSPSTLSCLLAISNVFVRLAGKHNFKLKIVGGGRDVKIEGVTIKEEEWSLNREGENFQKLDIGVYPLPDNEWSLAKTPFKSIQYMAVGVPCVASKVGGNKEIIQDGVNGFLAENEDEWFNKLDLLLSNKELREKIGMEGRKVVVERYSLQVNAPKFIEVLTNMRA